MYGGGAAQRLLLAEYATEPDAPGVGMAIHPEYMRLSHPATHPRITGRIWARRFTWTPRHSDASLFTALVAECGPPAGSIAVDSSTFTGPHGKLGVGSSAGALQTDNGRYSVSNG